MGVVIGETAEIGDDCTIYQGVTLGGTALNRAKRHPTLERGVVVGAGAKVLGPFTVGAGARIGSNSVVIKAVPAGATAVGIPARVIVEEDAKRREEQAAKMGFSAYAVTQGGDDPLATALHRLIDHVAEQDRPIEQLQEALRGWASECQDRSRRWMRRRTQPHGRLTNSRRRSSPRAGAAGKHLGARRRAPTRRTSMKPPRVAISVPRRPATSQSGSTHRSSAAP